MDYVNKIAIVTGGTSGIGLALSEELVRGGAGVLLVARNRDRGDQAVKALTGRRGFARFFRADVTQYDSIASVVSSAFEDYGRLDYMFNNAGIGMLGEARDLTIDHWREVIDVNLIGVVNGVAAAYPRMVRQGYGHIVNTSSVGGFLPTPGLVAYTAAKFGVLGLSLALRLEGAPHGVRVSVVCPARVETPIFKTTIAVNYDPLVAGAQLPGSAMSPAACARSVLKHVAKNSALIAPGIAAVLAIATRYIPQLDILLGKAFRDRLLRLRQSSSMGESTTA